MAGGILAGTVSATAAGTTPAPGTTQEQGTVAPEHCPEGTGGGAGTPPGSDTEETTPGQGTGSADVGWTA